MASAVHHRTTAKQAYHHTNNFGGNMLCTIHARITAQTSCVFLDKWPEILRGRKYAETERQRIPNVTPPPPPFPSFLPFVMIPHHFPIYLSNALHWLLFFSLHLPTSVHNKSLIPPSFYLVRQHTSFLRGSKNTLHTTISRLVVVPVSTVSAYQSGHSVFSYAGLRYYIQRSGNPMC